MAIIKKYNKANGTTYVYESVSYWDKEKQQPRSKRKLIGKIDPETGEVVPTNGKGRKSGSVPLPSVDASSSPITCTVSNDDFNPNDYQILYEEARSALG